MRLNPIQFHSIIDSMSYLEFDNQLIMDEVSLHLKEYFIFIILTTHETIHLYFIQLYYPGLLEMCSCFLKRNHREDEFFKCLECKVNQL